MTSAPTLRAHRFITLSDAAPAGYDNGILTRYMRLQNALIAWSEAHANAVLRQDEPNELVVVLPDAGAVLASGAIRIEAPARSICILPPGPSSITLKTSCRVIRAFAPLPAALAVQATNAPDYKEARPGVKPIGSTMVYTGPSEIRVYEIERFKAVAGKRPPSFQTGAMNVMWIERTDPTDPTKLDPHSHEDFEEGALVVSGEYIEHLRTPWGQNASQWREDEHVTCRPGTLIIVPPTVIHTTEALGPGPHLMLNIFAPARADHIKSGMVLNAKDYTPA
jgi:mannose-6-phosphate isomerase-like protein (cupin superfamily)